MTAGQVLTVHGEAELITHQLRAAGQPDRATSEKAYLKSDLDFFGAGVPAARAIVRAWARDHPDLGHDELTAVVADLWARPHYECRMAAQMLLIQHPARLGPADIPQLEQMLREARTWALVDSLTCDLMGPLVQQYPELGDVLDRWAADPDFWIRRSALLSLLLPLRRGGGDFDRFARYADQMLAETEFFIRKAIGWVLRETAKKRPELVAAWLEPRISQLSGVTLREAVKPLPEPTRAALLALRPSRRGSPG
jgi:3-methyladenine DNA glycosylase AlkD